MFTTLCNRLFPSTVQHPETRPPVPTAEQESQISALGRYSAKLRRYIPLRDLYAGGPEAREVANLLNFFAIDNHEPVPAELKLNCEGLRGLPPLPADPLLASRVGSLSIKHLKDLSNPEQQFSFTAFLQASNVRTLTFKGLPPDQLQHVLTCANNTDITNIILREYTHPTQTSEERSCDDGHVITIQHEMTRKGIRHRLPHRLSGRDHPDLHRQLHRVRMAGFDAADNVRLNRAVAAPLMSSSRPDVTDTRSIYTWCQLAGKPAVANAFCREIEDSPDRTAFLTLLSRLLQSVSDVNPTDVADVINEVVTNPASRKAIFHAAFGSNANCSDNVKVSFHDICCIAHSFGLGRTSTSPDAELKAQIDFGRAMVRQHLLDKWIALKTNGTHRDALEVQLKLRTDLHERLRLPFNPPPPGQFCEHASTTAECNAALRDVTRQEKHLQPAETAKLMMNQPGWLSYITTYCTPQIKTMTAVAHARVEALESANEAGQLSNEDYPIQANAVNKELEDNIYLELLARTEQLLKVNRH